jgi:hypothetical protein
MISPAPGTALPSSKVVFTWTTEAGAREFILQAGTADDATRHFFGRTTGTSLLVGTLPADGSTVYVRLYIQHADTSWTSRDYLYTAAGTAAALRGGRAAPAIE